MVFERVWDDSCPRVWDRWETDGKEWVIQDIDPADDAEALELMVQILCADETLCKASNLLDDPVSVQGIRKVWKDILAQRMSLGCYTEVDGKKKLVAMNACHVVCEGEEDHTEIEGEAWKNVFAVLEYFDTKCNSFKHLGLDKSLHGMGLVVSRQFRGAKLGGRILAARKPLSLAYGLKGSATVFTGPASQKLAEKCGFRSIYETTLAELADQGLKYPREDKVLKLMVINYE